MLYEIYDWLTAHFNPNHFYLLT